MDGIHDLGGMQGFGQVQVQENEPVFHAPWEAKVFAMQRTAYKIGACQNIDQFRHSVERIDPIAYLTHGYYGRWLGGIETLCVEAGVLTQEELNQRVADLGGNPTQGVAARPNPNPPPLGTAPAKSGMMRPVDEAPRFAVGQSVRAKAFSSQGHTRLPRYARGKQGVVVKNNQGWVFPDTNAMGQGECPQFLYTVAFTGKELWGEEAEEGTSICIDLFEEYLQAV